MKKAIYLKELNTVQVEALLQREAPLFIPMGTLEPHGRHLPVGTDTLCAERVAEYLSIAFDGVVAPSFEYGLTNVFLQTSPSSFFPVDLYRTFVEHIVKNFYKQGFKKIIIINGHGGNQEALKYILRNITREAPMALTIINWWIYASKFVEEVYNTKPGGHAAVEETAAILHSRPDLVTKENYNSDEDDCVPTDAFWMFPPTGEVLLEEEGQGRPCFDKEIADIYMGKVLKGIEDRMKKWFASFSRLRGGLRP
jgi:creatinine amidohydrolase